MNTREKFYAIRNALNANGGLSLQGDARLEGAVWEIRNLERVRQALVAWDSFPWSEMPENLLEDIRYLETMQAIPTESVERMQNRLREFSDGYLTQAEPMAVLEDAVADFGEELFQMRVEFEESMEGMLERASRAIRLPEGMIVEGQVVEPSFANGSLEIYWPFVETEVRRLWLLGMYCWQEFKALFLDPVTAHIWAVFDNRSESDPETVRNMKKDYVRMTFGDNKTLVAACEATGVSVSDVREMALKIAAVETEENVSFQFPLSFRRTNRFRMQGVTMEIRDVSSTLPEESVEILREMIGYSAGSIEELGVEVFEDIGGDEEGDKDSEQEGNVED